MDPPKASSPATRTRMQANRSADTGPEMALRAELQRRGLRFRKNLRVRTDGGWTRPDIVFTRARIAVFVDGCFWHRCPEHGQTPKANGDFWQAKFDRNVARDRANDAALRTSGWIVLGSSSTCQRPTRRTRWSRRSAVSRWFVETAKPPQQWRPNR